MDLQRFQLLPASEVGFGDLVAAFNRAYGDYHVPIMMSTPALRALIMRDDIALESSVVAERDGRILGMGLLGVRESEGWIAGMGVIPPVRRQGIGRALLQRLLSNARAHRLMIVRLEVIAENAGARALYRELGFGDVRRLHVLQRAPGGRMHVTAGGCRVEPHPVDRLIEHYGAFHDRRSCWQRSRRSLTGLFDQLRGWGLWSDDTLLGYALGWARRDEIRLADLATKPGSDRPAAARALLTFLHGQFPEAYGLHYNVGDDDPALPGYAALGYVSQLVQHEMAYRDLGN